MYAIYLVTNGDINIVKSVLVDKILEGINRIIFKRG